MTDEKKVFKKKRWHKAFMEGIEKFGQATTACVFAAVSRQTYYRELEHDEFRSMCLEAKRANRDNLLLRVAKLASGADGTPKSVSLQAAIYLLQRADNGLRDSDLAASGSGILPTDRDDMTITVTESMAKKLWPMMRSLHQEGQSDPFDAQNGPNGSTKKPN